MDHAFETDNWPFIGAQQLQEGFDGKRAVRLVVIHDMEFPKRPPRPR